VQDVLHSGHCVRQMAARAGERCQFGGFSGWERLAGEVEGFEQAQHKRGEGLMFHGDDGELVRRH